MSIPKYKIELAHARAAKRQAEDVLIRQYQLGRINFEEYQRQYVAIQKRPLFSFMANLVSKPTEPEVSPIAIQLNIEF